MTEDFKVWMEIERRGDDDNENVGEPVSVGIFNTYEEAEANMLRIASQQPDNDLSTQELARIPDHESDEEYRKAAKDQYQDEGSIEIDDNAIVSRAHDHTPGAPCTVPGSADAEGAYVAAWVWITASEAEA